MKGIKRFSTIMLITLMIFSAVGVYAVPGIPHQFWGDVTIDGVAATDGVSVDAKIDGVTYATGITTDGQYGSIVPLFKVSADDPDTPDIIEGGVAGDTVKFYVDGVLAATYVDGVLVDPVVFENGIITNLDLAATSVAVDTGTLSIITTPVTGEVFVEGLTWGDAPASDEVEVGTYTVTFGDKDGYTTPVSQEAEVTVDAITNVEGVYVLIPKLVITYTPETVYENDEVTITVKADEATIAGVSVYIHDPSEQTQLFRNTDALGQCTFTAYVAGDWWMTASKLDYIDAESVTITVLEYVPPVLPQLVITYTPETVYLNDEITVTVEAEEAPIVNVDVTIINPEGDMQLLKVTDDLGQCTFTAEEAGDWTIHATKTDYTSAGITIDVLPLPDMGTLSISTNPAGGEVFVEDESWGTDPAPQEIEVGTYTVSFGPMDGYTPPDTVEATVLVGETEEVLGTYTLIPPELVITYTPETIYENDLITITITADSEPMTDVSVNILDPYGNTVSRTTTGAGTCSITADIPGDWIISASKTDCTDADPVTVTVLESVLPDMGTLSITTTPVTGEVSVEGSTWGDAPQSQEVDVGTYTVTFGDMEGYTTPASQEAVVTKDTVTEIEGIYVLIPVGPTADFSIDKVEYVHEDYVDYADVLTVGGSGVTAGTTVNIYWDYASGTNALLLNNTEGKPDATFECEIKVPSDKVGSHYLWAKDTSTGETVRYGPIEMVPKLKLSPSSGLVGDDITIKGYGFTDEANFTSITFDGVELTDPTKIETDEDGYFTYKFEIAKGTAYGEYTVRAEDFYEIAASATFTLGASITLDIDEGPTGIVVEVEGRGWTPGATISFTIDDIIVRVVDDDVVKVKSAGTFSADIVIPDMTSVGEYDIEATESDEAKGPADEEFEVTGLPKIKLSPGFGPPGAMIDITGYNFTQIKDTEVTLDFGTLDGIKTFKTDSKGEFSGTFQAQALAFSPPDWQVLATDEYGLSDDANFRLGMMVVIISPISGPSGDYVYLTGTGFEAGGDWNATLGGELIAEDTADEDGVISAFFYAPDLDVGIHDIVVLDIESEIELPTTFTITDTTRVTLDPTDAPNEYNLTIEGYNFADTVGDLEFVLYNATDDWEMEVLMDPGQVDAATDADGNFTAYWIVLDDETLSIGDYTINVTGSEGLFAQVPFSLAAELVDVQPRKTLFNRGDVVQFDVENDFDYPEAYMKIWDPNDNLYWRTTELGWLKVAGLYTVPYYMQTSGGNPMLLAADAPLGTWTWTFYSEGTKNISDGTFDVGPSPASIITGQIDELSDQITEITDRLGEVTDDLEDDIGDLAEDIADVIAEMEGLKDEIVDDLADDIAAATDAGQAASDAVDDLESSMSDLEDAMGDIATTSNDALDAAQAAADAAADAATAAQEAGDNVSGLTGLVYGAIFAALIAALAAIVSLMQISKKIAG